jgi:hypothetical protein
LVKLTSSHKNSRHPPYLLLKAPPKNSTTLGEGDISVSDEENSDDLDRLNRDVSTITKDIVDIDR